MPEQATEVIVGVDTHTDTHTAVAIDQLGRRLASIEILADAQGYRCLLEWARPLGELSSVGVEGTGSYGAELARFLTAAGVTVIEVGRVNRQHRRRYGKSDPLTLRPPRSRCYRANRLLSRSPVMGSWNRSAPSML